MPDLNYRLRCSDLCGDFKEDLDFHFSFGITSLMVCVGVRVWYVREGVVSVMVLGVRVWCVCEGVVCV